MVDLGPLPEVDPRDDAFIAARRELADQVRRIRSEYGLDLSDLFGVLAAEVSAWAKVAMDAGRRAERDREDDEVREAPRRSRTL